jgi:hypothetical protein
MKVAKPFFILCLGVLIVTLGGCSFIFRTILRIKKPQIETHASLNEYLLKNDVDTSGNLVITDTALFAKYLGYMNKSLVFNRNDIRILPVIVNDSQGCNWLDERMVVIYESDKSMFREDSTISISELFPSFNANDNYTVLMFWAKWLGKPSMSNLKSAASHCRLKGYNFRLVNLDPNGLLFKNTDEFYSFIRSRAANAPASPESPAEKKGYNIKL